MCATKKKSSATSFFFQKSQNYKRVRKSIDRTTISKAQIWVLSKIVDKNKQGVSSFLQVELGIQELCVRRCSGQIRSKLNLSACM